MEDLKQWYAKLNAKAGTAYHKPTDPKASAIPHPNEKVEAPFYRENFEIFFKIVE